LFFFTGTLITSFFSSPVEASLVVTSFSSSSTTGTTSCVEFYATGAAIGVEAGAAIGVEAGTANGTSLEIDFFTTLFLVTGTFIFSFFSSPVEVSFVITSFSSSSTIGTTS